MRIIYISFLLIGVITSAYAQDFPSGCYVRNYDADHLDRHPQQTVSSLTIWFDIEKNENSLKFAEVDAEMADTPSNRKKNIAGKHFQNGLYCETFQHKLWYDWIEQGAMSCFVDCDGGFFQIVKFDENQLLIKTQGVVLTGVVGGCEGYTTLKDEKDGPTTYKLYPAHPDECSKLRGN